MPGYLSDSQAVLLCRTHRPSAEEIRLIIQWAISEPSPDKLGPMLVLFTHYHASQQFQILDDLYAAMVQCAASDDGPLWECIDGDYDRSRIDAACEVLRRLGAVDIPSTSLFDALDENRASLASRRASWPVERDQLPIPTDAVSLADQKWRAVCRSFRPSPAEIRQALDWALDEPSVEKLPYLLILQTENYAFAHDFQEYLLAALRACARADPEPLFATVERDYDMYRIWAAALALLSLGSRAVLERLVGLTPGAIGWCARDEILAAAEGEHLPVPAEADGLSDFDRGMSYPRKGPIPINQPKLTEHPDLERRRQAWPKELDRLPRSPLRPPNAGWYAESLYPAVSTELTSSLERIRIWLSAHCPRAIQGLNPGLTNPQIAEYAGQLARPLPAEIWELFRWHDGSSDRACTLDAHMGFWPLARVVEEYHELNDMGREYPGFWKPEWLPLFMEGTSIRLVALPDQPQGTAPVFPYSTETGRGEVEFESLTAMMAALADAYEEGVFRVHTKGYLDADLDGLRRILTRHRQPVPE